MVQARLEDVEPELIVNCWRHAVRYLFEYLVLKPI